LTKQRKAPYFRSFNRQKEIPEVTKRSFSSEEEDKAKDRKWQEENPATPGESSQESA
jgi:hypothetical protein